MFSPLAIDKEVERHTAPDAPDPGHVAHGPRQGGNIEGPPRCVDAQHGAIIADAGRIVDKEILFLVGSGNGTSL